MRGFGELLRDILGNLGSGDLRGVVFEKCMGAGVA